MRVWSLRALAQVLVVCLFSLFLEANFQNTFAQSDLGKISGFIIDQSGAPVPNAKITVRNQSGIERQATTNDTGYFLISNVPPGFYAQRVRDIIYQPGYSNWNMGLFKAFRSTKRWDSNSAPRPTTSGIIRTGAAPADAVERPTSDWTGRSFPPSAKCSQGRRLERIG